MRLREVAVVFALALAGCPTGGGAIPGRDAGLLEAGTDARAFEADTGHDADPMRYGDALSDVDSGGPPDGEGLLDASVDGSVGGGFDAEPRSDAGTSDGGLFDGGRGLDASTTDGGRRAAPRIDGVLGEGEWDGAAWVVNTTATNWAGNELRSMRALLLPEGLYLAIEGTVGSPNAIVVYVDRARGSPEGVLLATLTDSSGELDDAMTAGFMTPSDVRPDFGWGTLDWGRSAAVADPRMGWRDFVRASSPADLYWILSSEAPTTCGVNVCETHLPRAVLDMGAGASRPRTIAIFARITNGTGLMTSNQTLPEDMPSMPYSVTRFLTLDE